MTRPEQEALWWVTVLRDVSYALRNQDDISRQDIAAAIDRELEVGVPDGPHIPGLLAAMVETHKQVRPS